MFEHYAQEEQRVSREKKGLFAYIWFQNLLKYCFYRNFEKSYHCVTGKQSKPLLFICMHRCKFMALDPTVKGAKVKALKQTEFKADILSGMLGMILFIGSQESCCSW